jgi:hypothetical protein
MIVLPSIQAGIVGSKQFVFDADAENYINRVIAADVIAGNSNGLEFTVKFAINNFVIGLKTDGIWNAINSCCILAGARTYQGCLIPLKGPNPIGYNFSSSNYNRKNGLSGGGTPARYIESNTTNLLGYDYATNSKAWDVHASVFVTDNLNSSNAVSAGYVLGSDTTYNGAVAIRPYSTTSSIFRARATNTLSTYDPSSNIGLGFIGVSRGPSTDSTAGNKSYLSYNTTTNVQTNIITLSTAVSQYPNTTTNLVYNIHVFQRNYSSSVVNFGGKMSFYSIGNYLDLNVLASRVKILMDSINSSVV